MITHDEVKTLLNYTAQEGVAVSLYLDMDVHTKGTLDIQTKDMIKNARRSLIASTSIEVIYKRRRKISNKFENSLKKIPPRIINPQRSSLIPPKNFPGSIDSQCP